METKDIIKNLTLKEQALVKRFFDLAMGRVIKKVYDGLDGKDQKKMDEAFQGDDEKKKEEFAKKYLAEFDYLFLEEAKLVGQELSKRVSEE